MSGPQAVLALALAFQAPAAIAGPAPADPDPWVPLRFLLGDWQAVPGADGGRGSSSFAIDLGGAVLVRRNHAEYPARGGRPASTHDDRMCLYREGRPAALRAIYFDNEGHVIHYQAEEIADGRITLVSEVSPGAPRYRLSYAELRGGKLSGTFEIAPPDKPDAFAKYLEWVCERKPRTKSGQIPSNEDQPPW